MYLRGCKFRLAVIMVLVMFGKFFTIMMSEDPRKREQGYVTATSMVITIATLRGK